MRHDNASRLVIPALKSFGDFVIAMNAVQHAAPRAQAQKLQVVASQHLLQLAEALDVAPHISFIGSKNWTDVPAAFDVGKRGPWAALRSLLELRYELARVAHGAPVLFDKLAWRERFICGAHPAYGLPEDCGNIYVAYHRGFANLGWQMFPPSALPPAEVSRAVIVPGSRIPRKLIPASVLRTAGIALRSKGIQVSVLKLDGESFEVPGELRVTALPRSFSALTKALMSVDLVISADSLSAHLAEYHRIATFVLTPVANRYWLPLSAWRSDGWATFDSLEPLQVWLNKFSTDTGYR